MARQATALVMALALLSLAVFAMTLFATRFWVFELFTHFRLQLVAGQLVLAAILGFVRRPRLAVAVLIAALVTAYPVRAYWWPSGNSNATETRSSLSLMTVNVLGRNERFDSLVEAIAELDPDIVVIQEFRPHAQAALANVVQKYPHRHEVARTDNYGMALYSKYALDSVAELVLEDKLAIGATVALPARPFRFIGTHLSAPVSSSAARSRLSQLDRLASIVTSISGPKIIAGDFNLTPFSPYFTAFLNQTELRDSLAGHGPAITWPSFLPILGIPIDHVLVSSDWRVVDYRRLPAFGSDHYPIYVVLD